MPFWDNYWWLRPLAGLAFLAYMLPLFLPLFRDLFQLDMGLGILWPWPDTSANEITVFVLEALFCLAIVVGVSASAIPARRRKLQRIAAIRGNPDIIPLARVLYGEDEIDLEQAPIIVQRQLTGGWKWAFILGGPPFALLILASVVVAIFFDVHNMTSPGAPTIPGGPTMDIQMNVVVICLACIIPWLIRYTPTAFGKPYGVIFAADGIRYRSQYGTRAFLRWEDARVFEVSAQTTFGQVSRHFRYYLYGEHSAVAWNDPALDGETLPLANNTPEGTILAVRAIHDKTGLAPRTFVKGLQADTPGQ